MLQSLADQNDAATCRGFKWLEPPHTFRTLIKACAMEFVGELIAFETMWQLVLLPIHNSHLVGLPPESSLLTQGRPYLCSWPREA